MRITGTFLDEISYDIPHQNWSNDDWDRDFAAMKAAGIDKVILIRCGVGYWLTYPSKVLAETSRGFTPPVDLVQMFLDLSEKYGMKFFFGTYDSGRFHAPGQMQKDLDTNLRVVDEVWRRYGQSPAFKGWYLTQEISRSTPGIVDFFVKLGKHCKGLSNNLPTLISPYIDGSKSVDVYSGTISRDTGIRPEEHYQQWNDIMAGISGAVDIVAFQDGHVDFTILQEFLEINKKLADKHGLTCWTNSETFDRDMPIKFLPIKWEKLLLKLNAAQAAGYSDAITFEFSHFMSPNSSYPQAHGLYRRYGEYLQTLQK